MSDNPSASVADVADAPAKGTCFLVIGFGKKTNFETGRVLDLDTVQWIYLIRLRFNYG